MDDCYDSEEELLEQELELILENAQDDSESSESELESECDGGRNETDSDGSCNTSQVNSINNLIDRQYMENYKLSRSQYGLMRAYFEENEERDNGVECDKVAADVLAQLDDSYRSK
jgi:hypothetical protein